MKLPVKHRSPDRGGGGGSSVGLRPTKPRRLSEDLNALKISLGLAGSRNAVQTQRRSTSVVCELSIQGKHVTTLECAPEEIGLSLSASQARSVRSDERFQLPGHLLASLGSAVPAGGVPLWLSFPLPCGYLPALPWEAMLRPRIAVPPILRLSYSPVQPITRRETRDILLCFSFPRAKEAYLAAPHEQILQYFFQNVPPNLARSTTFHLFVDSALFPAAAALRNMYPGCKIEVYTPPPPDSAPESAATPDAEDAPLDDAWLKWMRDSLGSRSVDIVHFICHGWVGREEGCIALSESPRVEDDEAFAHFVGARQLCAFLDQVGAWSVAFSSPPGNYSILGMRLLQDQIARMRPGPVLFHDMARDPDRTGLDEAYQFAYAVEEAYPPKSDAVTLSCHPEWAMPWAEGDAVSKQLLDELTLAGHLPDLLEGPDNTPSWLASGQRALESSLSSLLTKCAGDPDRALKSGAADALRFTANLLQRHAHVLRVQNKQEMK